LENRPNHDEIAARFAAIVASSDDAIVSKDLDGVITSWNPAAVRMFGYSEAEAVGRHITLIIPEERRSEEDMVLGRIRRGEAVDHFETLRRTKDGREVAISLTVSPIRGASGEVIGASKIARDVTHRRRADARQAFLARATEALASSLDYEATLATVARLAVPEVADQAAVDLADGGGLRRVAVARLDPAKVALLEEIERRNPLDPDGACGAARVLRTGLPELVPEVLPGGLGLRSYLSVPLRLRDRTLGVLTFAVTGSNRRYDGDDLALALSLADRAAVAIENARLLHEAERARAAAEAASRAKDEFLAMLGHELRNPLAPIVTALALLKLRGGAGVERERAVIDRQVKHMIRLVDDLLDVSRVAGGKVTLHLEPVDVADVVARSVETVSPLIAERAQRLSVATPSGLLVNADASRLAQVVTNLLHNAAKYTPKGGAVEVGAARTGDHVELWVRDTGRGIAPEMLPKVFDLFFQVAQPIDRAQGGLGLGLSLVKSLVALHGGSVAVESGGVGAGSRFAVRLPAAGDGAVVAPADISARWATLREGRGARILVVDDSVDAAELLGEVLTALGCEVSVAHDGPAALALAAAGEFDLAVLDIGLPVMDGYELARRLRALEGVGPMKLVAATGYGQPSDRARTSAAGFDAHLVKPIDLDELRAVVERLIGRLDERPGPSVDAL
jgi:PAS domain S-box-containing protein